MVISCIMGTADVAAQDGSESGIRGILEEIRSHKKPYYKVVHGKNIRIDPGVFSPAYFPESEWFAEVIPPIVGKGSFLEVGAATGIVALFTKLNGAAKVTMTDIIEVQNANRNFKKHRLKGRIYRGDVFDALPMGVRYDFIFWAHPFHRGNNPDEDVLSRSVFDYQYQGLERYVQYAYLYLAQPQGRLLLGTGGPALLPENFSEIERIAAKNGYRMGLLRETKLPLVVGSPIISELRVYEFLNPKSPVRPR